MVLFIADQAYCQEEVAARSVCPMWIIDPSSITMEMVESWPTGC